MSDSSKKLSFSRQEGHHIDTYEYRFGLVHATMSDAALELLQDPATMFQYSDRPEVQLRYLLEVISVIHERRRYLDTLGTVAGMSLFAARMECIKQFVECAHQLKRRVTPWQLPLSAWTREADCPPEVRRVKRHARAEDSSIDLFLGNVPRIVGPGHREEWWVDMPIAMHGLDHGNKMPAFPLAMATGRSEEAIRAGEMTRNTIYFPMGYETLLEGNAHSLARSCIGTNWPALPDDVLVRYGAPLQLRREHLTENHALMRDHVTPYNVTDLMVGKLLRGHGVMQFPRALILKLGDIALSDSDVDLGHAADEIRCDVVSPARVLVDILADSSSDVLRDNALLYPDHIQQRYAALLAKYKQGGDWDRVQGREYDEAAIYVWESFLAHHVTVPLLERRLASGNAVFCEENGSLAQIFDTTLPLVEVINDRLAFKNIPHEVQTAWLIQMMQGEIAHQVLHDAELILCPRAHKLVPGMASVDLSGGHCDRNKRRGCGSWQPGGQDVLPACLFTRTLGTFGFIPIQGEEAEA